MQWCTAKIEELVEGFGLWYELVCSLLSYNDDVGEDFVDLRKIVLDFKLMRFKV